MAEYIDREAALALIRPDDPYDERWGVTVATAKGLIRHALTAAPAADVVPVVHCKECEYSYDISGRRRCSHGICCGRAVPPDFYCAEGKRKEPD